MENLGVILLVGIGGFFGALSRYWVSSLIKGIIPIGTLIVNILGSLFLGFLITLSSFNIIENRWVLFIGTGFLGSFTTMSTFVVETIRLGNSSYNLALLNIVITLICVFIGGYIGQNFAIILVEKAMT